MAKPDPVRSLDRRDTAAALALYRVLTLGPPPADPAAFHRVLDHPGTHVVGAFAGARLVAMATLHLLPNVTWDARPYGLIENVVTDAAHRKRGYGRMVIAALCDMAWDAGAYKVMLMSGQKRGANGFYQACGFSTEDKFAFVIRRA
jgi:GNAT superfamily N-acetyltransferase